jgi:hypothetical protein
MKAKEQKEFLFVIMLQLSITLHHNKIRELKYSLKEKSHYAINVMVKHCHSFLKGGKKRETNQEDQLKILYKRRIYGCKTFNY